MNDAFRAASRWSFTVSTPEMTPEEMEQSAAELEAKKAERRRRLGLSREPGHVPWDMTEAEFDASMKRACERGDVETWLVLRNERILALGSDRRET